MARSGPDVYGVIPTGYPLRAPWLQPITGLALRTQNTTIAPACANGAHTC